MQTMQFRIGTKKLMGDKVSLDLLDEQGRRVGSVKVRVKPPVAAEMIAAESVTIEGGQA